MARKPKKNRGDTVPEIEKAYRKPGLETSHPHIATMFAEQGHSDHAESLTHTLFPALQKRVCTPPPRKSRTTR